MASKDSHTKTAGALLFLAGLQFVLLLIIAETQYPGYSTSTNTVSDLAGSCPGIDPSDSTRCVGAVVLEPSATIFSSAVFILGVLVLASSALIYVSLKKRVFSAILTLLGVGAMGVGVFPGNMGVVHMLFSLVAFLFGGLAPIAAYRMMKRPMNYLSAVLGLMALSALVLTIFLQEASPLAFLGIGGAERMIVYPIIAWLMAFGGYLMRP